ncbi:UDP-glucuronate:xylan alpha-glucuronosyltransferase 1 [Dorcoceras hygrometricum]|uniref:UDP-glucuronate:xylan alpha-glucuronosyltransferase 1 n=1 Tax=Dorcoceras hygrometricum TaxID=472368 RepID=A0A2Z7BXY9_9LAMI|nr:UDP-glucuronate:xylan alpha-glucuronosyltransferase 1 [Dorcoceras hygrometricum]
MSRLNSSSTRVWKRDKEYLVLNTSKCRSTPLVNSSSTRVWKRDKEYLVLNTSKCRSTPLFIYISQFLRLIITNPADMNSKQSPSRCLLFLSLKPAATTSRSIHDKTSQNDIVPTNLNDIVAFHQLSLFKNKKNRKLELERRSSAGSYSDQQMKIQQMRRDALDME